jgi:hypothetical protein
MDKFDDLFDDFMNNLGGDKKDNDKNLINKIFDNFTDLNSFDKGLIIDGLNETLGEPDKLENYEENGVYFQKQIWNTKHGQVIKTILSDVPFSKEKSRRREIKIPLEVQLETAVKEENYELAVKLRDRINKRNANKTKK